MRSATQRKLVVPRYRLNSFGRQRFSVADLSTWNSLPGSLRHPELSLDTFKRQVKTYIFAKYWRQNVLSALEIFLSMRYINLHFTYLLTYLIVTISPILSLTFIPTLIAVDAPRHTRRILPTPTARYSGRCLASLPFCCFVPWLFRSLVFSPPVWFASWLVHLL